MNLLDIQEPQQPALTYPETIGGQEWYHLSTNMSKDVEPVSNSKFVQISMDLMTDLPPSEDGYDTLLVVLDHSLSKGAVLILTVKTVTATGTAELLKDNIF